MREKNCNYLHEVEKYMSAIAPKDVKSVMGIKYRNAILFEVYNLVDSPYSCRNCVSLLKKCVIVLGMTWVMGVGVLQTLGRQNLYAKTMWMAVVINVSVNFALIPKLGSLGAAIATLFTEIFNAVMFYWYSRDVIKNSIRWISYLKLLIIAIAASSLAKWLVSFNDFNLIVKMALAGCVFGLIYVVFVIMLLKSVQDMAKRVLIKLIK